MSGLYNAFFKVNPLAGALLSALKLDHKEIGRFRDCFLSVDGTEIIVYTRTGGNNRADHLEENEALRKTPGYKRDDDEPFDSTYARFYFEVPEIYRFKCRELGSLYGVDSTKRWKETLEAMRKQANG